MCRNIPCGVNGWHSGPIVATASAAAPAAAAVGPAASAVPPARERRSATAPRRWRPSEGAPARPRRAAAVAATAAIAAELSAGAAATEAYESRIADASGGRAPGPGLRRLVRTSDAWQAAPGEESTSALVPRWRPPPPPPSLSLLPTAPTAPRLPVLGAGPRRAVALGQRGFGLTLPAGATGGGCPRGPAGPLSLAAVAPGAGLALAAAGGPALAAAGRSTLAVAGGSATAAAGGPALAAAAAVAPVEPCRAAPPTTSGLAVPPSAAAPPRRAVSLGQRGFIGRPASHGRQLLSWPAPAAATAAAAADGEHRRAGAAGAPQLADTGGLVGSLPLTPTLTPPQRPLPPPPPNPSPRAIGATQWSVSVAARPITKPAAVRSGRGV